MGIRRPKASAFVRIRNKGMEPMQSNMRPSMAAAKSKVWIWAFVAVVAAAAALIVWKYVGYQPAPVEPTAVEVNAPLAGGDTSADISKDLETVDLGDVGSELNQLDSDINQL